MSRGNECLYQVVRHWDFGFLTMGARSRMFGRTTAQVLILVDDQSAIPGPAQGNRMVGEGMESLPRFAMIEELLRVGLANVVAIEIEAGMPR